MRQIIATRILEHLKRLQKPNGGFGFWRITGREVRGALSGMPQR